MKKINILWIVMLLFFMPSALADFPKYYVIIEADNLTGNWDLEDNKLELISNNTWLYYHTDQAENLQTQRAWVMKLLFFGTGNGATSTTGLACSNGDGSNCLSNTSINTTAIYSSLESDEDLMAYFSNGYYKADSNGDAFFYTNYSSAINKISGGWSFGHKQRYVQDLDIYTKVGTTSLWNEMYGDNGWDSGYNEYGTLLGYDTSAYDTTNSEKSYCKIETTNDDSGTCRTVWLSNVTANFYWTEQWGASVTLNYNYWDFTANSSFPAFSYGGVLLLQAIDNYTNTMYEQDQIDNFTVELANGSETYSATANGSFVGFGNLTGLWNITYSKEGYNNRTYADVNLTETFEHTAYLYQTHFHEDLECHDCVKLTGTTSGTPLADSFNAICDSDCLMRHWQSGGPNNRVISWINMLGNGTGDSVNLSYANSTLFNIYMYSYYFGGSSGGGRSSRSGVDCTTDANGDPYNYNFSVYVGVGWGAGFPSCSYSGEATYWSDSIGLKSLPFNNGVGYPHDALYSMRWNNENSNKEYDNYYGTAGTTPAYILADYFSNFTIAVFDEVSGVPLQNATITIAKWNNASNNRTDELGSDTLFVYPFDSGTYDISIDVEGTVVSFSNYDLATEANYLMVEVAPHYLNLSIYNWSSYPTLSLMSQLVDITLTGETIEYFENTSTGNWSGYLNEGSYTLKLESTGFETNYYFFDLGGVTNVNTYMFETGSCSDVDFTIQDIAGTVVEDAKLSFYKQINLTWVVVTEKYSDISGIATVCLDNEAYKLYVEKEGFDTWTGEFTPTQSSYTISLAGVSGGSFSFQDIFGGISFYYSPTELNQFGETNFSLTVSTISNNVQAFSIFSNYDGVDYETVVSGSLAGGQATIELPLDNDQRFFNVSLYIESVDNQTFNSIVYFQSFNFTPSNYSLLVLAEEWIGTEDAFTVTFLTYLFVVIILALLFSAGAPLFAGYGVGVFLIGTLAFVGLIPVSMATVTCILLVGLMVVSSEGWL